MWGQEWGTGSSSRRDLIISYMIVRTFKISGCNVSELEYDCIHMHSGHLGNTFHHLLIRDLWVVMPEMISIRTESLRGRQRERRRERERERVRG